RAGSPGSRTSCTASGAAVHRSRRPGSRYGAQLRPLAVRGDEVAHFRIDDLAPATSAEDAVVAGARGGQVALHPLRDAGAQVVRGPRLALPGNVVEFALDGEQRDLADVARHDVPALAQIGRAHV